MKLGQFIITCLSLIAFLSPKRSEGQTISGVINTYYKAVAIIDNGTHTSYPSYSGITLQSIAGLSAGDRVLIIQMKGATINETTNSSNFGNINVMGNAGAYEFSSICGFINNTVVLNNDLLNDYDAAMVQVVRVPVYNQDITVTSTLTATPWNASTGLGGVLAFEVNGTLTLSANINADGTGFNGGALVRFTSCSVFGSSSLFGYPVNSTTQAANSNGAYKGEGLNSTTISVAGGKGKQSNGGGGGNNHNAGGGGGGNYGGGGNGGEQTGGSCNGVNDGVGGLALNNTYGYNSSANKIFLGGGGGSGHSNGMSYPPTLDGTPGGNGGGIIYIKASSLIGNSQTISANGTQGLNPGLSPSNKSTGDGGGGGGAGGVVLLNIGNYTGIVSIESKGANGNGVGFQAQCPGPGGGGGGGVIWYAGAAPLTTDVSGGDRGVITSTSSCNNTASAGSPGLVQSGFVSPQGPNPIDCSILPLDLLKQFNGKRNNLSIQLNWILTNVDNVQKVILERKTGNGQFKKITEQFNPSTINGFYTDEETNSNVTYRLVVYALNGERQYSNQVFFEAGIVKTFNLYPNPATDEVTIQLPADFNGKTHVLVTDITGRQVINQQLFIQSSQMNTVVSVKQLPAGIYNIRLENKDGAYSAKLLKQ